MEACLFPKANEKGWVTILQLTSMLFFLPAILAYVKGFIIGTCIYFANGFVSIVVHRANRRPDFDIIDAVDHCFIAVWVAYNGYLYYHALQDAFTVDLGCALIFAIGVVWAAFSVKKLEWRSNYRYCLHGIMHSFGALGSIFLLRGAQMGL